jgi:Zn finger protein HypA/HybF involved in hydrogenase expression
MAGQVPAGSDVSSGTYTCTECGFKLHVATTQHLPSCPACESSAFYTASGDEIPADRAA